jgi:hypothetical protein
MYNFPDIRQRRKVIVSDFIGTFKPGDIFLISPNLPHVFRDKVKHYTPDFRINYNKGVGKHRAIYLYSTCSFSQTAVT